MIVVRRRTVGTGSSAVTVNYADAGGSGRTDAPLLLVHGLGGRWQHWQPVIDELARGRRVVALDLPGFGESPLPASGLGTLEDVADAIAMLVRALELAPVTFVGHSFGGPLATIFAQRHPQLVERLVLVCGTVQTFQQTLAGRVRPWLTRPLTAIATVAELFYAAVALPQPLAKLVSRRPSLRVLALWPFVMRPSRLSEQLALMLIEGAGRPGVLPTARAIARASGWERLTVRAPLALINADHDLIAPLPDLRAYPGRVDHVSVIEGSGHLPMVERPQAFAAALIEALSR